MLIVCLVKCTFVIGFIGIMNCRMICECLSRMEIETLLYSTYYHSLKYNIYVSNHLSCLSFLFFLRCVNLFSLLIFSLNKFSFILGSIINSILILLNNFMNRRDYHSRPRVLMTMMIRWRSFISFHIFFIKRIEDEINYILLKETRCDMHNWFI